MTKVLLIGYGNPGRLDDGLGPALAEALADRAARDEALTVESNYQLSIEDAALVAEFDVVIFADASVSGREPFEFKPVVPADPPGLGFSSHSVSPEGVVALARELFHAKARAYVLGLRGYAFNEFGERLSDRARENLAQAAAFVAQVLETGDFSGAVTEDASSGADTAPPTGSDR